MSSAARYALNGEGNTRQLQGIDPPLIRLRAQDHRVFFRDKDEIPGNLSCARSQGGIPLGYEAKKTEHCGPKHGNGAYWGYKWEAKKESNRIRRENAKREIREASAAGEESFSTDGESN